MAAEGTGYEYIGRSWDLRIETDENGFELHIESDQGCYMLNLTDPEAFYDHVKAAIGPWLYERDMARVQTYEGVDGNAYALSDPKHPEFHSIHADIWDAREEK